MYTDSQNLIERLLEVISYTAREKDKVEHEPNEWCRKWATQYLDDMHFQLCEMLSEFLAAPLTGRLHLPRPESYVNPSVVVSSLNEQLLNPQ